MKKLLSILLILAMVLSLGVTAFAEEEKKDDPDLKTFLSEVLLKRSAPVCQMPTRSRRSLQRT